MQCSSHSFLTITITRFKHATPHALWGIFPRLAYEIFEMKTDGWKVTMKYFQNVVDTVRDLMSTSGAEQHYKNGMRKDPDGFMDIEWCETKVINSWNHLREEFQRANARKAIAPTQFNPMSTRGHCIMVLEVEMPNPDNPVIHMDISAAKSHIFFSFFSLDLQLFCHTLSDF